MAQNSQRIVIGMDPHKRSVTIEVMAADEAVLSGGRFSTNTEGYQDMLAEATAWPDRVWAIRNHFASWTGTAPIDASSGDHVRHRLSRGGNRQINRTLHVMATVQLRHPTEGRAYFDRKKATGTTSMEAMRCLKRRLSDQVYEPCWPTSLCTQRRAPEGNRDTTLTPARPAHIPSPALRTSHSADPPNDSLRPLYRRCLDTEGSQIR